MLSLNTPTHDSTNISYIKNEQETGKDIIFVSIGFLIHSETVTKADAIIGRRFMYEFMVIIPRVRLTEIKNTGHITLSAQFFSFRFTKTNSLNIPTKLGMTPPIAPRHK
jgi:hypothetical protein